jgi:hypothetical protein
MNRDTIRIVACCLVVGGGLLLHGTVAPAAEGTLVALKGARTVLVWKDAAAAKEGYSLMNGNADAAAIIPLVACAPEHGTPAVTGTDEPGPDLLSVTVSTGKWAGCRGVVAKEHFQGVSGR